MTGRFTGRTFGTPAQRPYTLTFGDYAVRDPNNADNERTRGIRSAVPTSGTYAQGDKFDTSATVAGGFEGWVCITGGSITTEPWVGGQTIYGKGGLRLNGGNVYIAVNAPQRLASTAYTLGQVRSNNGINYKVTTAGTTGTGAGPIGTTLNFIDGTVVWAFLDQPVTAATGGPTGVDPSNSVLDGEVYWLYQPPFAFKTFGVIAA